MSFKKFRWSKVYESSEEELITLLHARNINGERIHKQAGDSQIESRTKSTITIWCAEGSLLVKGRSVSVSLQPGDALRLEANMDYSIQPGIADCVYYLTI